MNNQKYNYLSNPYHFMQERNQLNKPMQITDIRIGLQMNKKCHPVLKLIYIHKI